MFSLSQLTDSLLLRTCRWHDETSPPPFPTYFPQTFLGRALIEQLPLGDAVTVGHQRLDVLIQVVCSLLPRRLGRPFFHRYLLSVYGRPVGRFGAWLARLLEPLLQLLMPGMRGRLYRACRREYFGAPEWRGDHWHTSTIGVGIAVPGLGWLEAALLEMEMDDIDARDDTARISPFESVAHDGQDLPF